MNVLSLTSIIALSFYLYMVSTIYSTRFLYNIIVIIINLKYQDRGWNHLQHIFWNVFFFFLKLGWMTLNLQLPQGITLGMALQYAFIRILYSIILFMIEVIIRKKVLVFHSSNPKLESLNYVFVFNYFFRFAKYYVKDNVLYRTLLKAYGIRFTILVYGEVISN